MTAKKTAVENEVDRIDDGTPTVFEVEVQGEKVEFEDKTNGKRPIVLMMIQRKPEYLPDAIEALVGEDGLADLIDRGAEADDLQNVITAWSEAVQGK